MSCSKSIRAVTSERGAVLTTSAPFADDTATRYKSERQQVGESHDDKRGDREV